MTQPVVSIVLLSALRRSCTERCLESIDQTSPSHTEVVVVDMGGDPALKDWLQKEKSKRPRMKLILNDSNVGTSRGRNQAIQQASGDELFFLDNDAELTPGWYQAMMDARKRVGLDVILGGKLIRSNGYIYFYAGYVIDEVRDGKRWVGLRMVQPKKSDDPDVNRESFVPWYPSGAMIVNRRLIQKINGFSEDLKFVEEDKDLCFRATATGARVMYLPQITVIHDRVQDDHYDKTIRFGDLRRIKSDIQMFESVWNCRVELVYSKECLKLSGFSDSVMADMVRGAFGSVVSIVDDQGGNKS